jgi:hypothetical protein
LSDGWADAGREAWNRATRLGVDIKAHTQAELEALGRDYLEQSRQERDEAQAVSRGVTATAKLASHAFRPGTPADPGPGRLGAEWVTGLGPDKRVLGPASSFSREFVEAPSVQAALRKDVSDWRTRDAGMSGTYVVPHGRRANFGLSEFMMDLHAGNGASHFVGSWDAQGQRHGDRIDWQAKNATDLTSFGYGRILKEAGLPAPPSYPRQLWGAPTLPGGRTRQTILFSTDLSGRPLPTP